MTPRLTPDPRRVRRLERCGTSSRRLGERRVSPPTVSLPSNRDAGRYAALRAYSARFVDRRVRVHDAPQSDAKFCDSQLQKTEPDLSKTRVRNRAERAVLGLLEDAPAGA